MPQAGSSQGDWTQSNSELSVTVGSVSEVLLPVGLHVVERLSESYRLVLEVISESGEVDFLAHLGEAVAITVNGEDGSVARYFHGLLAEADHLEVSQDGDRYALTVRPWLWFLTHRSGYAVYQNKSAQEIVTAVFGEAGFSDYDFSKVSTSPPSRDYCVKFRESDYDFVMRLMEEEGLYFFFEHKADAHVLTVCQGPGSHDALAGGALPYMPMGTAENLMGKPHIFLIREQVSSSIQTAALRDFDFTKPSTTLQASEAERSQHSHDSREAYDYPGRFTETTRGTTLANVRLEAARAERRRIKGECPQPEMACGRFFTLSDHPNPRFNIEMLLVEVDYRVAPHSYLFSERDRERSRNKRPVTVRFQAVPATTTWRAQLNTPRPVARGPQTAIVTGPQGEEIYVDSYGRVKVHFHWDREQPADETCSCWVRVAHGWAGGGFGMVNLPRVGQEVVVDFLDGDPDRPLITGRVYNATTTTPYTLPDNKTQAGWRSKSIGSQGFNEIRYEDKADGEQIYVHAQKDMDVDILNNRTTNITQNETKTVKEGDETHTVSQGKRTTTVQMNDSLTVQQGNLSIAVSQGNMSTTLAMGDYSLTADVGAVTVTAETSITLTVGENSITISQEGVTISGLTVTAEAETSMAISGLTTEVEGETTLSLTGGTAELTGEAMTTIEGALVMIN